MRGGSILFVAVSYVFFWYYVIVGYEPNPHIRQASLLPEIYAEEPLIFPDLTLESLFHPSVSFTSPPDDRMITLVATGDVMTGRSVNTKSVKNADFDWPYVFTKDLLTNADVSLINLETPITVDCPLTDGGMIFCADEKNVASMQKAGIDIANIANNHIGNYGQKGIQYTKSILEQHGINTIGTDSILYKKIDDTIFAFLGYNDVGGSPEGIASGDENAIKQQLEEAVQQADIVMVSVHWGIEYQDKPSQRQVSLGHFFIDNGADVVIGHHPHWIQSIEIYNKNPIVYSHGNFIFDQMWSQKTREGIVTKYTFYDKKLVDVDIIPVKIEDYGQPRILEGEERQKILQSLEDISAK